MVEITAPPGMYTFVSLKIGSIALLTIFGRYTTYIYFFYIYLNSLPYRMKIHTEFYFATWLGMA